MGGGSYNHDEDHVNDEFCEMDDDNRHHHHHADDDDHYHHANDDDDHHHADDDAEVDIDASYSFNQSCILPLSGKPLISKRTGEKTKKTLRDAN